jgi:AAA domain/Homeodomain-like domain
MRVQELLPRLRGVRNVNGGWVALCPAHNDHNPSLSITESYDKILVFCHAGCSIDDMLGALGLRPADLFFDPEGETKVVATYRYANESGQTLFEVIREIPKAFKQRRPDGKGGWIWRLDGVRRVLYNLPALAGADLVFIVEGEKDVESARVLGLVATCNPGGAGKWKDEYSGALVGKKVVIVPDADEPGRRHGQQVAASLVHRAASIKYFELPSAKDLSEWIEAGGTGEGLLQIADQAAEWSAPSNTAATPSRLRVVSVLDLLSLELKPRELLLSPFLPSQGLVMLYSKRGVGKTYVALGISIAVASGAHFLRWNAPKPRKVLYVDGEMPGCSLKERLSSMLAGFAESSTMPVSQYLRIITPDLQERGLPDLASVEGQDAIEDELNGADLLVLDNLSALARAGKENEGEGWLPVQEWALGLRRKGVSVLFVHHAGKSGAQRGTSRREDLLDTVLTLKHSSDYSPSEGLRCEVCYEKTRGFMGDDAKPFEVRMELGPDHKARWIIADLQQSKEARALELLATGGLSLRDVAEEVGLSKSTVQRLKAKAVPIDDKRGE